MSAQWHLVMDLADFASALLFWACAIFPFVMAVIWPWWKSWWGRNIVSLEMAIASALLPSVLYREFGINTNTIFFGWVIVASLFAAAAVVVWRGVLIFQAQWHERDKKEGA